MAENTLQPLSDYKTFYHRYDDSIRDIATREVHQVFKWLYKGGESYVGEYMNTIQGSTKHLTKREKKKLNTVPTNDMDITLLYQIIRYTCGLSPPESNIWDKPTDQSEVKSIEHSLYQLKELRNELSHESERLKKLSDNELAQKIDEVSDLCRTVFNEAGVRSGKLQEAAVAINDMERDLKRIMGVTPEQMAVLGRKEKQKNAEGNDMDYYSKPIMYHQGKLLELYDLFHVRLEQDNRSSIIVVRGDAGAGKSSLCQYLDWLWTKGFENDVSELQTYDLTLTIDCRDVCTRSIRELLIDELLPHTMKWCNPYNIQEHLGDLKLLWIIDSLDEATDEATDLIRYLITKLNTTNHTFLIASRYECVESIRKDLEHHEYAEVFLHGVQPEDMFTKLMDYKSIECLDLKGMLSDFHKLDGPVKMEFINPLKLTFAINNWSVCKTLRPGFSLTQLYETIHNAQIEQLVHTCTTGKTTKNDAQRRAKTWFQCLCKVAFQATAARHGIELIKNHIDQLETECDKLQIPSSDFCLSSFLACREPRRYLFFHQTQRDTLAAVHAAMFFKDGVELPEILKQFGISEINIDKKELLHCYGVLLHMVAILKDSIGKKKAQELITLLSCGIPEINATSKWIAVMEQGDYKEIFLSPISEYFPKQCHIGDHNVVAAERFIDFVKPSHIIITILGEPEKVPLLESFLSKISSIELPVTVDLHLISHFPRSVTSTYSDNFLQLLCHEKSNCFISGFSGTLTISGLELFKFKSIWRCCLRLNLTITNIQDLIPLCSNIRHFQEIKLLQLVLDFNFDEVIDLPCEIPGNVTNLHLRKMTDEEVKDAIIIIRRLSQKYKSITFQNLTCFGALKFASQAKMKGLRVKDFIRYKINPDGFPLTMTFGKLPLQYSLKGFQGLWEIHENLKIQIEVGPMQIKQELTTENITS